jgi:ribonuclease Z
MKLVFLGTSGMVPTKERNVQSIYLEFNGEGILLDCGEGTQRQMQFANVNAQKIKKVLISHWHGDHVSGLVGLIQTVGNFSGDQEKTLRLYGPIGTKEHFNSLMNSCIFESRLNVEITELEPKGLETFYENEDYELKAVSLDHSVPCLGFRFERKEKRNIQLKKLQLLGVPQGPHLKDLRAGKNITYAGKEIKADDVTLIDSPKAVSFIFDTQLCDACYDLADGSDFLISEAVYKHDLVKKAEEYKHMTAHQAAKLASECGVKELILTHFSIRYKDVEELKSEAKDVFENTRCAYDLMKIDLPF